jgi:hypothetical protein
MTDQQPVQPESTAGGTPPGQPSITAPKPAPPPAPKVDDGKQPPWGKPENFDPDKAWELIENLRKEKGGDTDTLKQQLADMQAAQERQKKVLAEAFGLAEPPKTEDDLAETVKAIQEQLATSQREATKLQIAAEKQIPAEYHHLLTETDPERLKTQAETVAQLVQKAVTPPAFVPNPGQGQGGETSPEALADAEYEKYYPSPK